jgi:hypothetical protein
MECNEHCLTEFRMKSALKNAQKHVDPEVLNRQLRILDGMSEEDRSNPEVFKNPAKVQELATRLSISRTDVEELVCLPSFTHISKYDLYR